MTRRHRSHDPARRSRPAPGHGDARPAHARELTRVAGLPSVQALFAAAPERVERLFYVPELAEAARGFVRAMVAARRPHRQVPAAELQRIAGSVMHGGIVAVARPKPILELDAHALLAAVDVPRLLLVLDGVSNPHNLGAIARSAAFFGLDRLVISGQPAQALPSDAAFRIAEGGLDALAIQRATNLPAALRVLGRRYRIVGTALERATPLAQLRRDRPITLILGNEERGLDAATRAACSDVVAIPGAGRVQSLNVAAAAAVLIYELGAPR
jgi:TrmH RNA methyltransferase